MITIKKIVFLIVILAVWGYIMKPYSTNFLSFEAKAKDIKTDNTNLFTPKSGKSILPVEAQIALFLMDSLKLKDYHLFGSLGDIAHANERAMEIYQRINESAWPIRLEKNSRNLIGFSDEISANPALKVLLNYNNISVATY